MPNAAEIQIVAAVANPDNCPCPRRMTPAPKKPTPVTTPPATCGLTELIAGDTSIKRKEQGPNADNGEKDQTSRFFVVLALKADE